MSGQLFEGKTIEAALRKAAEELEVSVEELEHEEAEAKTDDFWGLGDPVVCVRAWVPGAEPQAEEAEPEVEETAEPDAATAPTAVAVTPVESVESVGPAEPAAAAPPASFFEPVSASPPDIDEPAAPAEEAKPPQAEAAKPSAGSEAPPAAADSEPATGEAARLEQSAGALLNKIFAAMEFDCTAEVRVEGDALQVAINGDDNQYLLDGRGRGLAALELILNHAFRHQMDSDRKKIRVDAGDFRSSRDDELRDLAHQVAQRAKQAGRTEDTEPLNSYERRIVHLTLADDPQVTTRSQGTGFLKAVSVIPNQNQQD